MPFPPDPPAQIQERKGEIRQESSGPNSPNIMTGNNSTVTIGGAQVSGVIKPSNGQRPVLRVPVPDNALLLNFGSNIAYSTKPSFVAVQFAGENMLSIKRVAGGLSLNARVYSPDGRIVADIEDNEFSVNPNNYFKIKHATPDKFVVYNQFGQEALSVSFVSPTYVVITGTFYKPGGKALVATQDQVVLLPSRSTISGSIAGENGGAAFAF